MIQQQQKHNTGANVRKYKQVQYCRISTKQLNSYKLHRKEEAVFWHQQMQLDITFIEQCFIQVKPDAMDIYFVKKNH